MPSASGMERLMLCPGSWQLAQKCEPLPETQAQKDGTRLHKAMEKQDCNLCENTEEEEACKWCESMERVLVEQVFCVFPGDVELERERRLWNAEQTYSGQADSMFVFEHTALVIDYKFGRGEVAEVQDNAQLMALAVLVADNYPQVEEVYCAILQPFASRQVPPTVRYTREDLEKARKMLLAAVNVATGVMGENPQLVPGTKQCQYCPAAQACPNMSSSLALMAGATAQSAELMSPQVLADRLALWKVVKNYGKQLEAVAKAKLQAGVEIPGYALTQGRKVFKVTDAQKAYSALQDTLYVTDYEFSECCSVSMGKLDALARELWQSMTETKGMTIAECKERLREMLEEAGAGEWQQQESSLMERRGE